jgi:endonuclease/exonuclease/phosphatase family metal-dependent hydrolase
MKILAHILLMLVSVLCYLSVLIPPDLFWIAGFMGYLIPFLLLVNIGILVRGIIRLKFTLVFPLITLALGWGFLTDSFHIPEKADPGEFSVMSYNVKVFNVYNARMRQEHQHEEMFNWLNNADVDIICFQEFFNDPHSADFNTVNRIGQGKKYNVYNQPIYYSDRGTQFGLAIFSKYKIIDKGNITFKNATQNQVIFADLLIGVDTVRVYNLHLQSMHINEADVIDYGEDWEEDLKDLTTRLKTGFIYRARQIRQVKENLEGMRKKTIVCGDLNDTPYSYVYYVLKRLLNNSFSTAGKHFGFTYNGTLPFLRIDHQFYSEGIAISSFETLHEIRYSDHFPVLGTYSLKKE